MAGQKISTMTSAATMNTNMYFPIIDLSESSTSSQNKKVSYDTLKSDMLSDTYNKQYIDDALGSYITDIAALVGGDA